MSSLVSGSPGKGSMNISPPRTIRESLNLFIATRPGRSIDDILNSIDWRGVKPHQVYYSTLDRHPESLESSVIPTNYSAFEQYRDALYSEEFQERVLWLLLQALPDKKRLIFVHIPKCAGMDLISHLSARYPYLSSFLSEPDWTDKNLLFSSIRDFMVECLYSRQLCLGGHLYLETILQNKAYRFGDEIFTVVRDPIDRVISNVNYAVRVLQDKQNRPEKKQWYSSLNVTDSINDDTPKLVYQNLCRQVLFDRTIIHPNVLSLFLGNGNAKSAVEAMARADIEVTDTIRYDRWLYSRWGIDQSIRVHASDHILCREDLSSSELNYINDICSEDLALYDIIKGRLDTSTTSSIRGLEIAG